MGRTRAQAADVPLDDEAAAGADDEEADDEALDFVSEPVDDEDEPESDDFEDDAGVLLDEEPRLSFR
ncbi:hypothetical protein A3Q37_04872 [Streptomyces sp. PTY087I2]|nr:hypothetical protein A3Q37_04872 [Streptomyces sp. PTY087I2]